MNKSVKAHKKRSKVTIILWLIFFFPVGLVLMFKSNWSKIAKVVISCFVVVYIIGFSALVSAIGNVPESDVQSTPAQTTSKKVSTPAKSAATKKTATPTSDKPQVMAWFKSYGNSDLSKFSTDFQSFSTDAENLDYDAVGQDCTNIYDDAATAQGQPAIPDATVNKDWTAMLGDFTSGAVDCQSGILQNDASEITKANDEITQGNTATNKVAADINNLK